MYRNDENLGESRQEFTLLELNNRIKGVIQQSFPDTYWVRAEMLLPVIVTSNLLKNIR